MTWRKSFKRLVRERQAQTGESYMTAMRHVRAGAAQPATHAIDVLELVELSELAAGLGLRCRVSMYRELLDDVEPERLLAQLHDALDRPDLAVMRAAVIDGIPPNLPYDLRVLAARERDLDEPGVRMDGQMARLWIGGRTRPVLVRFGISAPPAYALQSLPLRLVIGEPGRWWIR